MAMELYLILWRGIVGNGCDWWCIATKIYNNNNDHDKNNYYHFNNNLMARSDHASTEVQI